MYIGLYGIAVVNLLQKVINIKSLDLLVNLFRRIVFKNAISFLDNSLNFVNCKVLI